MPRLLFLPPVHASSCVCLAAVASFGMGDAAGLDVQVVAADESSDDEAEEVSSRRISLLAQADWPAGMLGSG